MEFYYMIKSQSVIEKESLIELYNNTNGPHWINNTNWGTDTPHGEWYGISTDSMSGLVTNVNLVKNN